MNDFQISNLSFVESQGSFLSLQFIYMTSLRKEFNQFYYSALGGEDLISMIKKQIPVSKLAQYKLLENRSLLQLDQKEDMRVNAQRYANLFKLVQKLSNPNLALKQSDYIAVTMGFMLNTGAFLSTIELLGDEKQVKYWQDQVLKGKAVGGYGQTQVGHGSDVKNLQTTATYNQKTKTWTINSPKITSGKYWPGLMGHFSTHIVLQAKTFVKGQKLGNQTFVVRIRNNNLQDLPTVDVFDIGPKLGFARVDNGGMYLKNLQAPRDAMLMRYVTVQEDGTVKGLQNESAIKYSYGSMLNLRIRLTNLFGWGSIVSPNLSLYELLKDMGVEKQPQHRRFLIQSICIGYGIILSNTHTVGYYALYQKELAAKNYQQADKLLVIMHIVSATFKAVSSRLGIDTNSNILTYNEVSKFQTTGIPLVFVSYIPSATYQGDNLVLLQQTSKFLLAKFASEREIKGLKKSFKSNDWESVAKALQFIILKRVLKIKKRIEEYSENNVPYQTIWNEKQQINLIQASTLWGYMTFLKNFTTILSSIKKNQQFYRKICQEFTNFIVKKTLNDFFIEDFMVEVVETWKNFTQQQYLALMEIDYPIERGPEPNQYIQRESGKWLNSKL